MDNLNLIQVFAPHFSKLVWEQAQVLLLGAILAPGQRTIVDPEIQTENWARIR
jgi:hypothetical protein